MTEFVLGAALGRIPGARYFVHQSLLELHLPRALPSAKALRRFRAAVPTTATLAVVIPSKVHGGSAGALRFDDAANRAWWNEALTILTPRFVVLATRGDLSPSARDRDLFGRFVGETRAEGRDVVWHAGGLFEGEEAAALAQKTGAWLAVDPFVDEPAFLEQPQQYARLVGQGLHSRLGDNVLEAALETLVGTEAEETFVAVQSENPLRALARIRAILDAASVDEDDEDLDDEGEEFEEEEGGDGDLDDEGDDDDDDGDEGDDEEE